MPSLLEIEQAVTQCRACPRLVEWREQVAQVKRASFADESYWGKPVPGWGDREAQIVLVGLAPAAHGANRTGRMFTGDRSGDWLYAALSRAGLANQPFATHIDDGLVLDNVWITASVRCAPPQNKPTVDERNTCVNKFLVPELAALTHKKVVVCLGKFAYDVVCNVFSAKSRPRFGHGVHIENAQPGLGILCSFHPSQQNTFTGKLTESMLDDVFSAAKEIAAS